eukprot:COSAG05_NODE_648_length_8105_cov_23.780914_2_plen_84_part_00
MELHLFHDVPSAGFGGTLRSVPLHFISLSGIQSSTGNPLIMRWVDFVHDEFSRVDSEISAFMTGFDRAVTTGVHSHCDMWYFL